MKVKKKGYIIQNTLDGKYWYGFQGTATWTDTITSARIYDHKREYLDLLNCNYDTFGSIMVAIIKVYY